MEHIIKVLLTIVTIAMIAAMFWFALEVGGLTGGVLYILAIILGIFMFYGGK